MPFGQKQYEDLHRMGTGIRDMLRRLRKAEDDYIAFARCVVVLDVLLLLATLSALLLPSQVREVVLTESGWMSGWFVAPLSLLAIITWGIYCTPQGREKFRERDRYLKSLNQSLEPFMLYYDGSRHELLYRPVSRRKSPNSKTQTGGEREAAELSHVVGSSNDEGGGGGGSGASDSS
ncbi:unnamed protein product [Vitrella brassicaformis CCMP3155]|uniref:Transmembrane protein n=1 Tax=Vitrella brassicaformis (strain CCMP3155) TaxID=1169540 RepID=A0A0G4EDJ3_VITBC|nr:unnamed protein product [Vitrella brassicaformis CCMP3155]|eukprot:CEL93575.1 unnamed protein product [Vitrella brassicaformis CCMP3155]